MNSEPEVYIGLYTSSLFQRVLETVIYDNQILLTELKDL